MIWLTIALGGACGALARFAMTSLVHRLVHTGFPLGTLFVNVLGSFLIGVLAYMLIKDSAHHTGLSSFLLVGFLGAFTTFSSFSLDTLSLLEHGQMNLAIVNIFSSTILCLLAVWIGRFAVRGFS